MSVLAHEMPTLSDDVLRAKAAAENFPVALRLLSRSEREDLTAIYGYARLVDDAGDELAGGPAARLGALDAIEGELRRVFDGEATDPLFVRLARAVERRGMPEQPFLDLLAANRMDQEVTTYATFEELLGYCRLSADPVGRLVLCVFGETSEENLRLSDLVCSGLQIVEHLQDVREDAERGRVYLPEEDLARFGVARGSLTASVPSPAFRRLLAFEVARTRTMLEAGSDLVGSVAVRAALAISAFVGGGLAQLAAIERAGYDVLGSRVKATAPRVAAVAAGLFLRRGRRS